MAAVHGLTRFRTHDLPCSRRLTGWEEHNARALVGLRAEPFGDSFDGTEVNLTLPRLQVARVTGTPHAVDRDVRQIALHPADGVVVYFSLSGENQFSHRGGTSLIVPGQALVVDGDQPFRRTFAHGLTELVLKAPRSLLREIRPGTVKPQVFGFQHDAHARALVTALSGALRGGPADWDGLETVATDLLGTLLGGGCSAAADLAAAHAFITAHLADQYLSAGRIAAAIGYSERHLSRLFSNSGQSVPQAVLNARLDAARAILGEPISLAEVAARNGFVSQAHFSRTYKARFGVTPRQDRRAFLPVSATSES
ncbi:AraC family transcriptional regulator [Lentzea aerocolonigenes]|uniref:AraC family transcriptional regulator n=1 Tax=Lentzea aerocolonigenes TaxID=68170 RepID=A0A0F0GSX4_LENAE|nr:AraC family transcriptional regulator [Lentzea aerocolonigenes]KJK45107.1 AraC family transcriptional regulator [Lentzea aerocolonigenes]